jgi:hypothetical protein
MQSLIDSFGTLGLKPESQSVDPSKKASSSRDTTSTLLHPLQEQEKMRHRQRGVRHRQQKMQQLQQQQNMKQLRQQRD